MKQILGLALLAITVPAFADIPAPPSQRIQTMTVAGQDAAELGESLDGTFATEAALRTSITTSKVFYSSTGLTQIVCVKTVSYLNQPEQNTCTIQQSKDGKRLKKYVRAIRMG